MDIKLGLAFISMTIALNGCATPRIVGGARGAREQDLLIEILGEADHPTVTVSWALILTDKGYASLSPFRKSHRFVLEPDGDSACSEFNFYANGDIPLLLGEQALVSPISVDAPILVTGHQPCTISLTYGAVGKAGFYGLVVSTDNGPIREIPLTGSPYLWLLTPFGVASDAVVVGGLLIFFVFGGWALVLGG